MSSFLWLVSQSSEFRQRLFFNKTLAGKRFLRCVVSIYVFAVYGEGLVLVVW